MVEETVQQIEEYGEEYDCDGLVIGGDTGTLDEIEEFLDSGFDVVKAVLGNHDDWNQDGCDEELECGRRLEWVEEVGEEYSIAVQHNPDAFDIGSKGGGGGKETEEYDIVIYGHSHMPYDRDLNDGTLAIGLGSTYRNYNTNDKMPDKSIHVLELDGSVVVAHIDFETGEILEETEYVRKSDGMQQVRRHWNGDGEDPEADRFIWG